MSDKVVLWTTFALGLVGAAAWIPTVWELCKSSELKGKIISRYCNINKEGTQTFFLFKLSVFSKNKPFNIREIRCELEDSSGQKSAATARNNRLTVFMFEKPRELLVPADQFLNNYSLLPADQNQVGYLYFHFGGTLDRKLKSTTFVFESFDKRVQRVVFKESDIRAEQLLHDDTIWQEVDMKEIQSHPALQSPGTR